MITSEGISIVPRILGIDPGGTTGVSCYQDGHWTTAQCPAEEAAGYIRGWIEAGPESELSTKHVAVERFVPSSRTLSFQPDALEIIGHTKYLCRDAGVLFTLQSPAPAKKLAPNSLLKTLGAYRPNTPHGLDAARHVILYMHLRYPELLRYLKGVHD